MEFTYTLSEIDTIAEKNPSLFAFQSSDFQRRNGLW